MLNKIKLKSLIPLILSVSLSYTNEVKANIHNVLIDENCDCTLSDDEIYHNLERLYFILSLELNNNNNKLNEHYFQLFNKISNLLNRIYFSSENNDYFFKEYVELINNYNSLIFSK